MSALLAQFSFLIAVIFTGAGLAVLLWRWKTASPALRAGIAAWYVLVVLVIALLFRYPATPNIHTPAEVEAVLANGQPTFVMLYSNYCMGCMANLPRVQEMLPALVNAGINTLLLDVNTSPAREMLPRFNFVSTPTFLLYAADGAEVYRSHGAPALTEIFAVVQ